MPEFKNSSSPTAVYVHLGSNLPKHLKLGLSRHQLLFPSQEIVLITSDDQQFDLPGSIKQFKVNTSVLEAELFKEMSQKLDFEFRKGFWKYTLQRFFAIGEFHKLNPKRVLTHIESDVVLMPNFPWHQFADLKKLAWLKVNSEVDVAAIVHFPTLHHTLGLLQEISRLAYLNTGTNDMLVLHDAVAHLRFSHEYLPSLTSNNAYSAEKIDPSDEQNLIYFGGIFDPLNLGLWYFGQDPKNSFGLRTRYVGDSSHDLNPVHTRLKFNDGVLSDQFGTSVYSLHVHSKYLPLFGANWESALKIGLEQALTEKRRRSFNLSALFQALKGRRMRQNLWILIAQFPGVKQLRKIRAFESLKNQAKKSFDI